MNRAFRLIPRSQIAFVIILLAIFVALAIIQNQNQTVEPYDPENNGGSGLLALVMWMEEMGYQVDGNAGAAVPADSVDLFWIHPSSFGAGDSYTRREADALHSWVEQGGTLVLVGPKESFSELALTFGVVQVSNPSSSFVTVRQSQPLLPDLPGTWEGFFSGQNLQIDDRFPILPVITHRDGSPTVALQLIGKGVVWHLTEDFALTNYNLREDRIASLLPAILRTVPTGGDVAVSTHHLARLAALIDQSGQLTTLQDWLYTTPFGQATLLIMVATFAYLLLQGRRLGPALPGPTASRPREAAEYVTALAGLQRRMRKPKIVADHYRQRLKLGVGRLAQIPADLPDAEWLAQLRRAEALSPALFNEVSELLVGYADIQNKASDEAELVELVQATDTLLASLPRATMQLVR